MKFIQIRHGSCIIELDNIRFLIDPIIYKKHTLPSIKGGIEKKNPLVDIPVEESILKKIDFIILTHLHSDHFDSEILEYYGNNVGIICSKEYNKKLSKMGFTKIIPVDTQIEINNFEIVKTKGKHGTGIVGKMMGKSYGFILKTGDNRIVYITGDTILCKLVEKVIERYKPQYIIGFAGSAMYKNVRITLDDNDIKRILEKVPDVKFIVNHMDAWNHCFLTKEKLRNTILNSNLYIPNDGEEINV